MPRIPDVLLKSVAFLYPSKRAAEEDSPGGSGFVALDTSERYFLVTNIHVAAQCSYAKVSGGKEETTLIHIDPQRWVHHPDGDDVSVCKLSADERPASAISLPDLLATHERMEELNAGVGDEVFMLGRFVGHGSFKKLQPLARFGNISMMPGELVKDGRNLRVEAFLVEMRSLSGFSGSPVFIHMGPGTFRGNGKMMQFYTETIGLIGIDSGHKNMIAHVQGIDHGSSPPYVQLNTGISIVVPYWKIRNLIDIA